MNKKDCMDCIHCTMRAMAYEDGITNTCDFQDRIDSLPMEELYRRIVNKTCDWFEAGTPKIDDSICLDD